MVLGSKDHLPEIGRCYIKLLTDSFGIFIQIVLRHDHGLPSLWKILNTPLKHSNEFCLVQEVWFFIPPCDTAFKPSTLIIEQGLLRFFNEATFIAHTFIDR